MKKPTNYFSNGNKQLLKEGLAVVGLMLFLAVISVILAWHKGHLIWPLQAIQALLEYTLD